ncbi:hypothetical protein J2T23_000442 [Pseudarthrobacter niigatensis]|uniref:Uncharacterized protein n=1 Tax=Pseudarthrobacter niigatensis TaxID=369935 RepID=A0AAJ1WFL4_9MICC|nr:hypothetical protein [Pseudarthrobacter niigatensis]MDQ0265214.1 hypothetical protein [Pseudarthrobacter niigatensis]
MMGVIVGPADTNLARPGTQPQCSVPGIDPTLEN